MSILVVVDRMEREHAVLVGDAGSVVVRVDTLPDGATEGTFLRVPVDESGRLVWDELQVEPKRKNKRDHVE